MRVLRITGESRDALCTHTTRNLLFAQYELVDHKVSVTSDEQEEECLCFSSAAALLPKNSAEPRFVARVVPEASERAEKEHLLERASSLSCEPSRPTCSKKASCSSFLSDNLDSSIRRTSRLNQSTGTHCCSQSGAWAATSLRAARSVSGSSSTRWYRCTAARMCVESVRWLPRFCQEALLTQLCHKQLEETMLRLMLN